MNNKKLLVISDSHGSMKALRAVFNWAKERTPPYDTICAAAFLGDGIDDIHPALNETGFLCNWAMVRGNNDYFSHEPDTALFDFSDYKFFICHGHRHNNSGTQALITIAHANNANVVLTGHTHVPHLKKIDGIYLINPGSVSRPRSRIGATFAVIECADDRELKVDFFNICEKGEIRSVKI
ncbi:MAG: YfcE family phosphodiesterase [Treponema sp.]|nr:YfcE family phosphodiesterase [Treponema sp.]